MPEGAASFSQPAARDLRFVVGVLQEDQQRARTDGDLAKNIAKREGATPVEQPDHPASVHFGYHCRGHPADTVKQAIDALVDNERGAGPQGAACANLEVDALYDQIHEEVMAEIFSARPEDIDHLTLKVFAVASGTSSVSATWPPRIAEEVIYVVEADVVRHQVKV